MKTILVLCLLVIGSTAHAADPKKITYDDHILPLLRDKCISCHGPDKKSAGLQLHNYARLMAGGSGGVIVKAGDPDSSALYRVVAHLEEPFMPPKSPMLPKENLELVKNWIVGGALENLGSKAVVAAPKSNIALSSVVRGKPEGPPPMPPKTLPLDPVVRTNRATAVTALASSPWAPLVAVGGQKQILLYNSDTLELLGILPFPEGVPHVLQVQPQRQHVARRRRPRRSLRAGRRMERPEWGACHHRRQGNGLCARRGHQPGSNADRPRRAKQNDPRRFDCAMASWCTRSRNIRIG